MIQGSVFTGRPYRSGAVGSAPLLGYSSSRCSPSPASAAGPILNLSKEVLFPLILHADRHGAVFRPTSADNRQAASRQEHSCRTIPLNTDRLVFFSTTSTNATQLRGDEISRGYVPRPVGQSKALSLPIERSRAHPGTGKCSVECQSS